MSESELTFAGFEGVDCRPMTFPDPPDNERKVEHIIPEDDQPAVTDAAETERQRDLQLSLPGAEDVVLGTVHVEDEGEHKSVDLGWFVLDSSPVHVEDDDYISYEQHRENIDNGAHDADIEIAYDSSMSPAEAVRLYGKRALRIWAGIAMHRAGKTSQLSIPEASTQDAYLEHWINVGKPFAGYDKHHAKLSVGEIGKQVGPNWRVSDDLARAINESLATHRDTK